MLPAILCQLALLLYHQLTTWCDLHPFNGARNYPAKWKYAEAGSNGVLMSLAPIGFALHVKALMNFGAVYYFVLFAVELIIWWVPYFSVPGGAWRRGYNFLLALTTSNFAPGDALDRWRATYVRLHSRTIMALPVRAGRVTPNVEHTILHAWTLVTAIVTLSAFFRGVG